MMKLFKRLLNPPIESKLPTVDFSSVCSGDDYEIHVLEPQVLDGNISLYELFVINTLVKKTAPKAVFEIGTFNGRTTLNLAANSPADARIYTLDLPSSGLEQAAFRLDEIEKKFVTKDQSGEKFSRRAETGKIVQLYGDSAKFDFGPFQSSMDLIFVDASHAYEYVLNDSRVALKLLRNGKGTILWHDYARQHWWPGVTRALNELRESDAAFSTLVHIDGTSLAYLAKI